MLQMVFPPPHHAMHIQGLFRRAISPKFLGMQQSPRLAETAPVDDELTAYDIRHLATYLRLLDAEEEGAPWQEAASIVLELDPEADPVRSRRIWASHLVRAQWMTEVGYRQLLTADQDFWVANRPHTHH